MAVNSCDKIFILQSDIIFQLFELSGIIRQRAKVKAFTFPNLWEHIYTISCLHLCIFSHILTTKTYRHTVTFNANNQLLTT